MVFFRLEGSTLANAAAAETRTLTSLSSKVAVKDLLQWCGFTTDATRKRVIEDIIPPPENLKHLVHESADDIQATFREYGRHSTSDGKLIVTRVQQKRIIALMNWAKDKHRLCKDESFKAGTTKTQFLKEIEEATTRVDERKSHKKAGESLITAKFQVMLENATQ